MKTLLVKNMGKLQPCDETGEDFMRHLAQGEVVSCEVKKPRNVAFHRKFFAMLSIILKTQDYYKNMEQLLDACKLGTGHYEQFLVKLDDETTLTYMKPKSISFAKMDDTAFQDFYDRSVNWIIETVLPGLSRNDLDEEVAQQLIMFAGD